MQAINDKKCLASWAVFKQLCDEGHKNIYEVLRDFIKATIFRNSIRLFTESSLTEYVNRDYEFNLKTAIVAYAVKELAFPRDPKTGEYYCDPSSYKDEAEVDRKISESTIVNNEILDGLITYAEQEKGIALKESEKTSLVQSLINYLLDNSYSDTNSTVISAYILRCKNDTHLAAGLSNILEGVVRYVGVSFDTPASASSHWTNEMTIYLDTEVLFHMAGFNGTLYKRLFDDFYELVSEINQDSIKQRQHPLISLRYFDYVIEEIDKFFVRASEIINGKLVLNPSITAMKEITTGCKTDAELAERKGLFLAMIKNHGIEPDNNETDFYHSSQYAYNLEDDSIIEKYCADNSYKNKKLVRSALLSLSHVNVLRQGISNRSFEKLGYTLLTDNYVTEHVARMDEVKGTDDKPLCSNLYFVTNRMWYRLGKTFGVNATPKVFDVISKAQIILSSRINDSVYSQYEKLVERMDKNEISGDDALEVLYQLRSQVKNPEEIEATEVVDEAMHVASEPELQKYIEDAEYRKAKLQRTEEENQWLNSLNKQVIAQSEEVRIQNESVLKENLSIKQENERVIAENIKKDAQLNALDMQKTQLEEQLRASRLETYNAAKDAYNVKLGNYVSKRKKQTKWLTFFFFLFLVLSIGIALLINKYDTWTCWPDWIKTVLTLLLGQLFPVFRSYVTKIDLKTVWKVIVKHDFSLFVEEYKSNNPEPRLEK